MNFVGVQMTRDNSNWLETWKVRHLFNSIVVLKERQSFVSPTQHSVSLERQMLESITRQSGETSDVSATIEKEVTRTVAKKRRGYSILVEQKENFYNKH